MAQITLSVYFAESVTAVKKRQLEEKNPYLGIDCNEVGEEGGGGSEGPQLTGSQTFKVAVHLLPWG